MYLCLNKTALPIVLVLAGIIALVRARPARATINPAWMDAYNVTWNSPSRNSAGSMPIGNGNIGLNVWVSPKGTLEFYLAQTDSIDGGGNLDKLGLVKVRFSRPLSQAGQPFRQVLRLRQGEIVITGGRGKQSINIHVWIDANAPVVRIVAKSATPFTLTGGVHLWRRNDHMVRSNTDLVEGTTHDGVVWYHRNKRSIYPDTLKNQHLGSLLGQYPDPLMNRTFGAAMVDGDMIASRPGTLVAKHAVTRTLLSVYPLTAQTQTPRDWLKKLGQRIEKINSVALPMAWRLHEAWWRQFWNRSWIDVSGDKNAQMVTRGYLLQRWMVGCSGRGKLPIKFNGGLFTFIMPGLESHGPDYRVWDGCYWLQNERLIYWPLIKSGDFDLLKPWFNMYVHDLPLARGRDGLYYHGKGAYFPETMYFWGTWNNGDFGNHNPTHTVKSMWMRRNWAGGLEVLAMALTEYGYTRDKTFARQTVVPLGDAITEFYHVRYPKRDSHGKILFAPARSLETWVHASDSMPDIAGLRHDIPLLLALPKSLTTPVMRARWTAMMEQMPPLPTRMELNGKTYLSPAVKFWRKINGESPELYSIFPFHFFGVGLPHLAMAQRSFDVRTPKYDSPGWGQGGIWAAYLGRTAEAEKSVVVNFGNKCPAARFPAFWDRNQDWMPNMCNGGAGMITLQDMLIQNVGKNILLLPAWPKSWSVNFKILAPDKTTVSGNIVNGKPLMLHVIPLNRRHDVVIEPFKAARH